MTKEIPKLDQILPEHEIKTMRRKGIISNNEIAYQIGDLLIAENVVTRDRRIISETLSETEFRVLKG